MSTTLRRMVNAFIEQQYPYDSFDDKTEAADASEQKVRAEVEVDLRKRIEKEFEKDAAKSRIRLGEKTRTLLLEGVLLAISPDLLVNHVFALLDCFVYGGGGSSSNVVAILAGFSLSLVASIGTVVVICLSGIRNTIVEYHALRTEH